MVRHVIDIEETAIRLASALRCSNESELVAHQLMEATPDEVEHFYRQLFLGVLQGKVFFPASAGDQPPAAPKPVRPLTYNPDRPFANVSGEVIQRTLQALDGAAVDEFNDLRHAGMSKDEAFAKVLRKYPQIEVA